jgi:hypothetical protein
MKKLLLALLAVAVAAGVFVALRGPRLPDMRDPTGMLPTIPDEWSQLAPDEAKELARTYGWRADAESLRMAIRWNDIAMLRAACEEAGLDVDTL